jgi:hypothetical protein
MLPSGALRFVPSPGTRQYLVHGGESGAGRRNVRRRSQGSSVRIGVNYTVLIRTEEAYARLVVTHW